jgi:hypothetical protein
MRMLLYCYWGIVGMHNNLTGYIKENICAKYLVSALSTYNSKHIHNSVEHSLSLLSPSVCTHETQAPVYKWSWNSLLANFTNNRSWIFNFQSDRMTVMTTWWQYLHVFLCVMNRASVHCLWSLEPSPPSPVLLIASPCVPSFLLTFLCGGVCHVTSFPFFSPPLCLVATGWTSVRSLPVWRSSCADVFSAI